MWSDVHKQSIGGSKKRDSTLAELDNFEVAAVERMFWQRARKEIVQHNTNSSRESTASQPTLPSSSHNETSMPATSGQQKVKDEPMQQTPTKVKDPEYDRSMQSLIVQIHKASGEWFRKAREYTISVLKSKQNPTTKGCKFEGSGEGCKLFGRLGRRGSIVRNAHRSYTPTTS